MPYHSNLPRSKLNSNSSVTEAFHAKPAKYKFIKLLKAIKAYGAISLPKIIELIKENENLLLGLSLFYPHDGIKLSSKNALAYVEAVEEQFQDKPAIFSEFISLVRNLISQRIDEAGVVSRLEELFKGHNELVLGFHDFFEEEFGFVFKIKARFQDDVRVLKSFLHIRDLYRNGSKSFREVCHEVVILFQDHTDLIEEFFLRYG